MSAQSSASQPVGTTARTLPAPPLKSETIEGLAGMIGKVRQIVRGETVTAFAGMSETDREEMQKTAIALIHSQDPVRAHEAIEIAKRAAEGVLTELGFVPSQAGYDMARRIAATAIVTHRLALEGLLDHQDGGVQ